jgi:acetylglutamate kinase
MMLDKITVVKIGGSTLGNHDTTLDDLVELQRQGKPMVVVHGGGKLITDWLTKLGVSSRFIKGERVTDRTTLEVVTAVLAGLVNKDIVSSINSRGGKAIGLSGVDGTLIEGKIGDPEKGYVGVVTKVNESILTTLMAAGFIPVIAPVGLNTNFGETGSPLTLNFNADIIAGEIAAFLDTDKLVFLTDVTGILDSSKQLIARLTPVEAKALVDSGTASGGMIPKIQACLRALATAKSTWIVDGRQPHALIQTIEDTYTGTIIGKN